MAAGPVDVPDEADLTVDTGSTVETDEQRLERWTGTPPWMLGQNITAHRRARNLSQTELGALVPSGGKSGHITRQTVSRWETGECMPTRHHLRVLAGIFGITEADLFSEPETGTEVDAEEVDAEEEGADR